MFLVRDTSANPKVWATDFVAHRRWVRDAAEAVTIDNVVNAYWPGVNQPTYPNYPEVSMAILSRIPETLNAT